MINVRFPQEDRGDLDYVLGLELERNLKDKTTLVHQHEYVCHILEMARMSECKPSPTPADPSVLLTKEMSPTADEERQHMKTYPYASIVGALIYLSTRTRPDIATAVSKVCRYTQNPGIEHWRAVKRILRYLKGTSSRGIVLGGTDLVLRGFADADWAGDKDTRRSTSGFLLQMGKSTIAWKSGLQKCATLSSCDAEIVSLCIAGNQALWIRQLLHELGFPQSTTPIFEDNQSCIKVVNGTKSTSAQKHIGVRYSWLSDKIADGELKIVYCPTGKMTADIFTKNLGTLLFNTHVINLNMKSSNISRSIEGAS